MQDQTERADVAREAFGLVAAPKGNFWRHSGGNAGGREMTIALGEGAQNPAYRRELHLFWLVGEAQMTSSRLLKQELSTEK